MDDLEAYAAGYAASLTVTAEAGAPIESASAVLKVFVLADAGGAAQWAADMVAALIDHGPDLAGFSSETTPTGIIYRQLARPTIPPDPEGVVTFESLLELRDAVVAAGLPCPAWNQDIGVPIAAESGQCSESSLLLLFRTAEEQIAAIASLRAVSLSKLQLGEEPVPLLVGPNWVVVAPEAREVADRLGGSVYVH